MSTTDSPHGKLMGPAAEYLRPATYPQAGTGGMTTASEVRQERFDHTRGLDWPAMRGVRFSVGHVDAWVSDVGHVEVSEVSVRDLSTALELQAVVNAAVELAQRLRAEGCVPLRANGEPA